MPWRGLKDHRLHARLTWTDLKEAEGAFYGSEKDVGRGIDGLQGEEVSNDNDDNIFESSSFQHCLSQINFG